MSYVLYGAPGSGSGIVEAMLAEIGAPCRIEDLDARHGEHRGETYAARNPHRKMPTLETAQGEILTETVAIVLTLDERHGDAGLLPPPGSQARATALRWMAFLASELYPLVEMMDYPERFAPEGSTQALHERAKGLYRARWRIVEQAIAGAPYLLEQGFCATDLYITVVSRWDLEAGWPKMMPNVHALTKAVLDRPALAPVWARHVRR